MILKSKMILMILNDITIILIMQIIQKTIFSSV